MGIARFLQYFMNFSNSFINIIIEIFSKYYGATSVVAQYGQ